MIYLDHGATTFPKPLPVRRAVSWAMTHCANPGRGGYGAAMAAAEQVYRCREEAAALFACRPEQVVLTGSCTQGLNIAIRSLVRPGGRVVISGFEHNAVVRPLYALNADIQVAGRRLFDWADTLAAFESALDQGAQAAVFTHVSNVFGYILPVEQMARMCRQRGIPFVIDAAQSAGHLPVSMEALGAAFIAMPGHKGLLGPQGTGILLCAGEAQPLIYGGTGSASLDKAMPRELPERLEAGTMNVPGFAGLAQGLRLVRQWDPAKIARWEQQLCAGCCRGLAHLGMEVFSGPHQAGTVSFRPGMDCEQLAQQLGQRGIALRAGLHCAPLAHSSAGTVDTGTVRVSFGFGSTRTQMEAFLRQTSKFPGFRK